LNLKCLFESKDCCARFMQNCASRRTLLSNKICPAWRYLKFIKQFQNIISNPQNGTVAAIEEVARENKNSSVPGGKHNEEGKYLQIAWH